MNLIDVYVNEVGRFLSGKNRLDIEAEIRSALQDLLDERSRELDKPVDEELTLAVLKEYGDPQKVAESYAPERYLIGPRLYPHYISVLQIVLPIVAALSLVAVGVSIGFSQGGVQLSLEAVIELIANALAELFAALVSALGSITLIFAILQWSVPDFKEKPREWDPRSLLKTKPQDHVKVGSLVTDTIFTGLALLVFNFAPWLISLSFIHDGQWWFGSPGRIPGMPILSDTFFGYLPLLNVIWIAQIALNLILLGAGRWQTWSRWLAFGLKIVTIGVLVMLLSGPSLIGITVDSLMAANFPSREAAELLVTFFRQGAVVALVIALLFTIVDAFKQIVLLTGRNLPDFLREIASS